MRADLRLLETEYETAWRNLQRLQQALEATIVGQGGLISDMLTFARGNSAHGDQIIDVAELLAEVERTVGPLRQKDQTLIITPPPEHTEICGNPRVLASALENLVVNAFQSAGRAALVRVEAKVLPQLLQKFMLSEL